MSLDLNAAFTEYLRSKLPTYPDLVVTGYRDETRSGGYCETCYYEEAVVYLDFTYADDDGDTCRDEWFYYGSFAELIRELTD